MLEFVETIRYECPEKSIHEAWSLCGCALEWKTNWPNIIKLWQNVLIILASTAICERWFSKQNIVKSALRSRLRLNTLDALMRISLYGLGANEIDWQTVLHEWRNMRDLSIRVLDWTSVCVCASKHYLKFCITSDGHWSHRKYDNGIDLIAYSSKLYSSYLLLWIE